MWLTSRQNRLLSQFQRINKAKPECKCQWGYMGISVPMAYKIIRRLNDELVAAGYIIVSGRISRSYFEKKIYGGIA